MYAKIATRKLICRQPGRSILPISTPAEQQSRNETIDRGPGDQSRELQFRGLPYRLTRGVILSHPRSAPTLRVSRSGW
jgi:hypothetical protein